MLQKSITLNYFALSNNPVLFSGHMINGCHVNCRYINLCDTSFACRGGTTVCMGSVCLSKMFLHSIEFEKRHCIRNVGPPPSLMLHNIECFQNASSSLTF